MENQTNKPLCTNCKFMSSHFYDQKPYCRWCYDSIVSGIKTVTLRQQKAQWKKAMKCYQARHCIHQEAKGKYKCFDCSRVLQFDTQQLCEFQDETLGNHRCGDNGNFCIVCNSDEIQCKSKNCKKNPTQQQKNEVCSFYLKGNCKFGNNCNFDHVKIMTENQIKQAGICKYFLKGKCQYGEKFKFKHQIK